LTKKTQEKQSNPNQKNHELGFSEKKSGVFDRCSKH